METLISFAWDLTRLGFYLTLAVIVLAIPVGIIWGFISGVLGELEFRRAMNALIKRATSPTDTGRGA